MTNWFGKLKRNRQQAQVKRALHTLRLVAFGKHPAWDDHMDDIGLDTAFLVDCKRLLYTRGIRENIDTGAWPKLEQEKTAIPFGHRFLWAHQQQTLIGRLWPSCDGRGRRSYPIVVGAHLPIRPPTWLSLLLLPAIEELHESCMRLSQAEELRSLLRDRQEALRQTLTDACYESHPRESGNALQRLATCLDRENLQRILYHITREARVSLTQTEARPERAVVARIPVQTRQIPPYIYWWFEYLCAWFSDDTIVALFKPDREPWVDVFIGEPSAAQVFALRAPATAVPFASDVPYTIPDDFSTSLQRLCHC